MKAPFKPGQAARERARQLHRIGLEQTRAAAHFALTNRDLDALGLAEATDVELALEGRTLPARLYSPNNAEPALLIYFHGGGFVLGDLDSHDAICRRLAGAGGFKVLSIGYRLAPEHPYPAQLDDAVEGARAAIGMSQDWGVDPSRIAIGGDSAGGYLAVADSLRDRGRFAAMLLIYPLLHLDEQVWADSLFQDARVIGRLAVRYIRRQLQAVADAAPSLLNADVGGLPPTIIVSGGALDPVRPDAVVFAGALKAAGVACQHLEYALQIHGFLQLTHVSPLAREAVADAGRRLAERLAP
jgi:acetyl esterase